MQWISKSEQLGNTLDSVLALFYDLGKIDLSLWALESHFDILDLVILKVLCSYVIFWYQENMLETCDHISAFFIKEGLS